MRLRIGTRKSALALRQAEAVRDRLIARAGFEPEDVAVVTFSSHGDEMPGPIASLGTKGAFTESLERALSARAIDIAVHSLKDLPVDERPGLSIGAVLEREDPSDVHVSGGGVPLASLRAGDAVGTGSPRRRAHLHALRPDLRAVELRGNVETRLEKSARGDPSSIVLAAAGLKRLGLLTSSMERLPLATWLPAPGQAAVAVQIRSGDSAVRSSVFRIDHESTRRAVDAERAALRGLGGGCLLPFGALARDDASGALVLRAVLYAPDGGGRSARVEVSGRAEDATTIGLDAAARLLAAAPWAPRA